jgi:hypothetical protein
MVGKSKILILSIFIFSLAFILSSIVFPKRSLACHLAGPNTYYQACSGVFYCSYDSQCGSGPVPAYDFAPDAGGCVMGYAAGQYYIASCVPLQDSNIDISVCSCAGPEAKWYTSPSYNRQICKKAWGMDCGKTGWDWLGGSKEGKWDSNESKCVVCNGAVETGYFDCSGDYSGDYKCESACGADPACDEKYPDNMYDTDSDNYYDLYCDSNCYAYKCDASRECSSVVYDGSTYKCSYNYYYSTSSPRYDWLIFPYEGYPWQSCFDNHDNDCDGVKDCADYDCKGVQNPNTGVICCQSDSDCPSKNNIKGKCDSPYGTDDPDTLGYTYTCYWKPCKSDSECVSGTYCYCGVCSSTFTSAGCDAGKCCNRGYGEGAPGSCVSGGTIYNSGSISYLCDPPEWNSGEENSDIKNESKAKKNIFESILSFFYSFFQR